MVEIPRYYKIKKNIIGSTKYVENYHWCLNTSYLCNGALPENECFHHEGTKFYSTVVSKGNGKTYYGCLNLLYGDGALEKLFEKEAKSLDEI